MTDYHTKPVLAVRVPGELQDWARTEAQRHGQRIGNFVTGLLAAERARVDPGFANCPSQVKISGEDPAQEYRDALAEHDRALAEIERTQRMVDRARAAYARTLPRQSGPWDDSREPGLPS